MPSSDLKHVLAIATAPHRRALLKDEADVSTTRGVASTEYLITGSLQAVFKAIERIFGDWNGLGYGTRVHSIEMLSDGTYGARVSHSNSCD